MANTERTHRRAAASDDMTTRRVFISGIEPSIDGGRVAIKRTLGQKVQVEVDLIADGHDVLAGRVLYRPCGAREWMSAPLEPLVNDRYRGAFEVDALGRWQYTVEGWVDEIGSWREVLRRRLLGGEQRDVIAHLRQGARLFARVSERVPVEERDPWLEASRKLDAAERDLAGAREVAFEARFAERARSCPEPSGTTRLTDPLEVEVERPLAGHGSWYEFFPRSCGPAGTHGRLRDCEARLEYVASMEFDVVYLPPIHPNGFTHRKGRNNQTTAQPGDPGSPWAIGGPAGGHKSVHPELGSLEDFRWFVGRARELGLEVALDIAFQTSPDHPYVREHPDWYNHRPDGSIQYAENPPKKYQDIYPLHFECEDAQGLWEELLSVFEFWIEQGVCIFRVDNPHTKSLAFWRWCIGALKRDHPEVILLSEAFTRPKLMYALAKLGFSQSYTYFTWRNTSYELREYFRELTQTEVVEYFRPNLWPNTPDILPENLQFGGRAAFIVRLVLAATLGANYGIYGPAYELLDSEAREGSGEYLDNEKYEIKSWDVNRSDSLRPLITRMNRIRKGHPALHEMRSLRFHSCDNEMLLAYSKGVGDDMVLVVANLDFHHKQSGFVTLGLDDLSIGAHDPFQAHDLLGGGRFLWSGARNYVELDPHSNPVHVFRIRRRLRTEQDFDYFA